MVMKRSMMAKNLRQSIFRSMGRFIAIAVIIALGAAIFVGLRTTKADMVATGQKYMDAQNMFDLRLLSSYGWNRDQVSAVAGMEGVEDAEGVFYTDLIVSREDGEDAVYRFYTMPERINRLVLRGGRMPEAPDECLADGQHYDDRILGTQITIAEGNDEDALDLLRYRTFTVVGYVSTPLYMDTSRGSTSVGSGSITNYFFVPEGAFDADYYTEIHITMPGDYVIYSDEYNDAMDAMADKLEPLLEPLAQERLDDIFREAEEEYNDGLREYMDGYQEYIDGKAEADEKLRDGFQELLDAEDELRHAEWQLKDGERQIENARNSIRNGRVELMNARQTLAEERSSAYQKMEDADAELQESLQTVTDNLQQVNDGLAQINPQIESLSQTITQLETAISAENGGIEEIQAALDAAKENGADADTIAGLETSLRELTASRDGHSVQLETAQSAKSQLDQKAAELNGTKAQLDIALEQINQGIKELEQQKATADEKFAAAEATLNESEGQLNVSEWLVRQKEKEIADGWAELEEGKQEYLEGKQEYRDEKNKALQELKDAEAELKDAWDELTDARRAIDEMKQNDVIVLDRNSNMGYSALDSNSDIVEGVSRIFPLFFLLVAALVCITTMTRMVEEERTQIGTLKALGYGNGAIISKYLIYAGSTAVVGCLLGEAVGSAVFPMILWEAYKIIIYVDPHIILKMDLPLCIVVFLMYSGAMLLVTWYCCRRTLREVPAELIRPKAPTVGKQLIFEKLSLWNKIGFLNKVTIRNIFRYHQRLAMMLLGIGGCTALLLTGFGIRDTIVHIADTQFQEVSLYDITVYFQNGRTPEQQAEFLGELSEGERVMFFYQTSMELDGGGTTKDIYLIATTDELLQYQNLRKGSSAVAFPGENEVLLSVGAAEAMGIRVGDRVTLRDSDMRMIDATVSGIYENYVYNYAIVDASTLENQWGEVPDNQMAYVSIPEGADAYPAGAGISGQDGVMSVSVNEEVASMVSGMMDALDLVVVVVVVCAALLAVVVLYNLTNININERIREIATIKVLGFTATETGMYVFKENLALCGMGTVLGLLMGKLLLAFVIDQIRIDFVWFRARLLGPSYLWSVVLTVLTALLVDLFFYFRLEKINMAEALKSVE